MVHCVLLFSVVKKIQLSFDQVTVVSLAACFVLIVL